MAAALDVFRRHALEVQRLNLVEELAEELQGKNDELEYVLAQAAAGAGPDRHAGEAGGAR